MSSLLKTGAKLLPFLVVGLHLYLFIAALANQSFLSEDSSQYLSLSRNMWHHAIFSQSAAEPFVHDLQRTPGYPFFLMVCGNWIPLVLFIQHLLVFATAFFLFKILRQHCSKTAAASFTWIFLLMPYPAVFASLVLSETLFLFFLIQAFWWLSRYKTDQRLTDIGMALFVLALAAYVRPVALPLSVLFFGYGVWEARKLSWFSLGLRTLLPILFFLLLVLPWNFRNQSVSGRLIFSSMGDMGIVQGRMGAMAVMEEGKELNDHNIFMAADSILAKEIGLPFIREYYSEVKCHETELLNPKAKAIAYRYILSHPVQFINLNIHALRQMFEGIAFGWSHKITGQFWVAIVFAAVSLFLMAGVWLMWISCLLQIRRWNAFLVITATSAIFMLLISAASWADGRYRFPSDVLILIVAGATLRRKSEE